MGFVLLIRSMSLMLTNGDATGTQWKSSGKGEYTLEDISREHAGTGSASRATDFGQVFQFGCTDFVGRVLADAFKYRDQVAAFPTGQHRPSGYVNSR